MDRSELDKQKVLRAVIAQVETKLSEMRAGYGAARDAVLSSPHVMKGKREVFGQEAAYLANALALNIQEREYDLKILRNLHLPESPERVVMGCVVGVGPDAGPVESLYFLLPVCGGMEVVTHEGEVIVRVITSGTPIAKALLGKLVGDEVTLPTTPPREVTVKLLT
jgi:transcription elongation GreA/GreB family factor